MIGGMGSFQLGASIAKSLFPVFGPTGTAGLRILLSLVVLLAIWRPWRQMPGPAGLRTIVALWRGARDDESPVLPGDRPTAARGRGRDRVHRTADTRLSLGSPRLTDLLWVALVVLRLVLRLDPRAALRGVDPIGMAFAFGAGGERL
jgi:inner membrane transporter RhtA